MDSSRFSDASPGKLVRISSPDPDWAFVPDSLPPRWEYSVRLWPLLSEAKAALQRLDGIGSYLPNPDLLLMPLQQREALRSSSLEGIYATPEELLMFELHPRSPTSTSDQANAWREVANYGEALRQGYSKLREGHPLSLRLICQLHAWLLEGVRGSSRSAGSFRKNQVHLGSDRRYVPAPAPALNECLHTLEQYIHVTDDRFDPLVRCYLIHYQFEAIHPFLDGNGRVGRLLLSLMTYSWCRLSMPWLYMSAFFERYKDEYIDRLFDVSATGNWESWIEFCLRGTLSQARDSMRRADQLIRLKDQMHERLSEGSARLHRVIDRLFVSPAVTIPQLRRLCGVAYQTAKADVQRLVDVGILTAFPNVRPKTFTAPEILKIAYGESQES